MSFQVFRPISLHNLLRATGDDAFSELGVFSSFSSISLHNLLRATGDEFRS